MKDPRSGTGIHLQLEGEGAWPDLKKRHFDRAVEISVAALKHGTQEGHASLAIRFDTKQGRIVVGEMTLRELHSIWTAIVAAYGENWMKPETSDIETRIAFTTQELTRQLLDAKMRLGEPAVLDFTAADKAYEEFKQKEKQDGPNDRP